MLVFNKISDIKKYLRECERSGKTIGLVPTMGYLHEGHLSLIKRSSSENDITVLSIFVNPTQFGKGEDLDKYPRNLERDIELSSKAGADVAFVPDPGEMYPEGYKTYVEVEKLTGTLCGISRPTHFRGVTTVVTKLFNIVGANRAYFGQKDAQQAIIIHQMVKDLDMDTEVIVCPIVREADGLAMSSRNVYLSPEERQQALVLSQSLNKVKEMIEKGEREASVIKAAIEETIKTASLAKIDYVAIVDGSSLEEVTSQLQSKTLIALAVKFGATRLIDNLMVEV